ncbi:hypothetical protein MHYP_G00231540 [Metynnis hypsauchen]
MVPYSLGQEWSYQFPDLLAHISVLISSLKDPFNVCGLNIFTNNEPFIRALVGVFAVTMATSLIFFLLLFLAELLSTGFSIADLKCLRTFHTIEKKMNLSEARAACRTNYTDLVTVYSDEDNTTLTNLIDWTKMTGSNGVWIGLIRNQSSDK